VPHAVEVEVQEIDHRDELARIAAVVLVETESQKGILIGAGGIMIKSIGSAARRAIEHELGVHVHLELSVRVRRHWRADERLLDRLGIE
jgi:GTP-binding protein Era